MNEAAPNLPDTTSFPAVRQLGIVVKSIDRAVEYYSRSLGIGPWFKPKFASKEHRLKGTELISDETNMAIAFSGKIQLELVELISGNKSIYWEHMEKHGEGIHHLGVYVSDIEKRLEALAAKGIGVLQSGIIHSGGRIGGSVSKYAYLDTAGTAGIIFELIETKFLGFNIRMSRPWFELGCITGDVEKINI